MKKIKKIPLKSSEISALMELKEYYAGFDSEDEVYYTFADMDYGSAWSYVSLIIMDKKCTTEARGHLKEMYEDYLLKTNFKKTKNYWFE